MGGANIIHLTPKTAMLGEILSAILNDVIRSVNVTHWSGIFGTEVTYIAYASLKRASQSKNIQKFWNWTEMQ